MINDGIRFPQLRVVGESGQFGVMSKNEALILAEKNKTEQNSDTPDLEQNETVIKISRDEALKESERINFENENLMYYCNLNKQIYY